MTTQENIVNTDEIRELEQHLQELKDAVLSATSPDTKSDLGPSNTKPQKGEETWVPPTKEELMRPPTKEEANSSKRNKQKAYVKEQIVFLKDNEPYMRNWTSNQISYVMKMHPIVTSEVLAAFRKIPRKDGQKVQKRDENGDYREVAACYYDKIGSKKTRAERAKETVNSLFNLKS